MNLFDITTLKDKVLHYLSENKNPCISVIIYNELMLESLPSAIFNEYLREMDRDGVLNMTEMSGDRHLLFITEKGKKILFDGGYVKTLPPMTKKEKLHRIVEFLSTENDSTRKSSFDSGEIAKAIRPELDIYEVNTLCKILIREGVVRDCTSRDQSARREVAVLVINATHDAYHTKKYLEEDEEHSLSINQNITGKNIIVGDNSGTVYQGDNSTIVTENRKRKINWLKILYWVIGILVGLTVLFTFVRRLI